jgi:hypothetical protein
MTLNIRIKIPSANARAAQRGECETGTALRKKPRTQVQASPMLNQEPSQSAIRLRWKLPSYAFKPAGGLTDEVHAEKERDRELERLRLSIQADKLRFKREYQADEPSLRREELVVRRLEASRS